MLLTPAKARQLRKSMVEQLLKQHRIRRVDAETVLRTLREPALLTVTMPTAAFADRTPGRNARGAEERSTGVCCNPSSGHSLWKLATTP